MKSLHLDLELVLRTVSRMQWCRKTRRPRLLAHDSEWQNALNCNANAPQPPRYRFQGLVCPLALRRGRDPRQLQRSPACQQSFSWFCFHCKREYRNRFLLCDRVRHDPPPCLLASVAERIVTMDLQKGKARASQHYVGWRARRRPCSFQSQRQYFLLTLPFIERANRRS